MGACCLLQLHRRLTPSDFLPFGLDQPRDAKNGRTHGIRSSCSAYMSPLNTFRTPSLPWNGASHFSFRLIGTYISSSARSGSTHSLSHSANGMNQTRWSSPVPLTKARTVRVL